MKSTGIVNLIYSAVYNLSQLYKIISIAYDACHPSPYTMSLQTAKHAKCHEFYEICLKRDPSVLNVMIWGLKTRLINEYLHSKSTL